VELNSCGIDFCWWPFGK